VTVTGWDAPCNPVVEVEMAVSVLKSESIRVAYSDTGGVKGRVIEHTSDMNRTKVRYHDSPKSSADEIP